MAQQLRIHLQCSSHRCCSFDTWVRKIQGMEEGMATHASILAWRIPWTEEPGGLQATGSQRVRHDWAINTLWTVCGLPDGASGREPTCQCRRYKRHGSIPGQENSLEEGKATHASILAWRIPWTQEPDRLQFVGSLRVRHDWHALTSYWLSNIILQKRRNEEIST